MRKPKNNITTKLAELGYEEVSYSLYRGKIYHIRLRTLKIENKCKPKYFILKGNDVLYIAENQADLLKKLKEM